MAGPLTHPRKRSLYFVPANTTVRESDSTRTVTSHPLEKTTPGRERDSTRTVTVPLHWTGNLLSTLVNERANEWLNLVKVR